MVRVVLVRPEHPGNVGAVARAMANFGFSDLVLVDPRCDHLSDESMQRAKHAKAVLRKAVTCASLEESGCDWLVATSGKLGSDENIPRLPLQPWQLAGRVMGVRSRVVGVVFGPESSGLRNDELERCDAFLAIPTSKRYPILNLSHAVTVVLYELSIARQGEPLAYAPLDAEHKRVLLGLIDESLDSLPFQTPEKRETQRLVWHRLVGKSFLTRREGFSLMGFFKKVLRRR
ncbi:RNA methyltransferase [Candidatus Woesearchaeota archaeon]|nr:RNA methyltransferase [Candidatus Woesearchaeota archaeon]